MHRDLKRTIAVIQGAYRSAAKIAIKLMLTMCFLLAANVAIAVPLELSTPQAGSTITGGTAVFSWTDTRAQEYYLAVGSEPYSAEYFDSSVGKETTMTVSNLPVNGSVVFVTLYHTYGTGVETLQTQFQTGGSVGMFRSPGNGDTLSGATVTLSWEDTGAFEYYLALGSRPMTANFFDASTGTDSSVAVGNLPTDGSIVYATLYHTYSDGVRMSEEEFVSAGSPDREVVAGTIPSNYFGIHLHSSSIPLPPSSLGMGSVRLWDADGSGAANPGAQWTVANPAPGVYDWSGIDQHVERAESGNMDVVYSLGCTPTWATANSSSPGASPYAPGCADMPDEQAWRNWLSAVGTRYKGRIQHWEIWNEPALKSANYPEGMFFNGSAAELVRLAEIAYDTLKRIDPNNQIVSPSYVELSGLQDYLAAGGGDYADIIGFHFYQNYDTGLEPIPEDLYTNDIPAVRSLLDGAGLSNKPLWNTEAGSPTVETDRIITIQSEPARVARWLLLSWAAGIERFYFYDWDNSANADIALTLDAEDASAITDAGIAYGEVASWMKGKRITYVNPGLDDGVWIVQLMASDDTASFAIWSTSASGREFVIPREWTVARYSNLVGEQFSAGDSITLGSSPVLLW
ncbi:MAG: hypothetical protein V3U76_19785 [Granulosicoccus sp.]